MSRRSTLQLELLAELRRKPAASVAELASRVDRLRPSVSRSLSRLRDEGLVAREHDVWRLTPDGEEEARMTNQVEKSVSDAVSALDRAVVPLRSVADDLTRGSVAELQRALQPLERLTTLNRLLTENLAIMEIVRNMEQSPLRMLQKDLGTLATARWVIKELNTSYVDDSKRALESLTQGLTAYDALKAVRAEAEVLQSVRAIGESLKAASLAPTEWLQPFMEFEQFVRGQEGALTGESLARHIADSALASLPFHSLHWREPTGLLSAMEDPEEGASVSWKLDDGIAELGLALLRKPRDDRKSPLLVVETVVTCFLCSAPLVTQGTSFEWLSEERAIVRLPTFPVCAQCLSQGSPSYLERLAEALERRKGRPQFEIIQGDGEGTGEPTGREHLRLVHRDEPEGGESEE